MRSLFFLILISTCALKPVDYYNTSKGDQGLNVYNNGTFVECISSPTWSENDKAKFRHIVFFALLGGFLLVGVTGITLAYVFNRRDRRSFLALRKKISANWINASPQRRDSLGL